MNLYGYCGGAPVTNIDPYGLQQIKFDDLKEGEETAGIALARYFWRTIDSAVNMSQAGIISGLLGGPQLNLTSMLDKYKDRPGIDQSEGSWMVVFLALDAASVCDVAGFNPSFWARRYPKAGGGGIGVDLGGENLIRVDVHGYKLPGSKTGQKTDAPFWKWPHIDSKPLGLEHFPWKAPKGWPKGTWPWG